MAVGDRGDDVLRAVGRIAAEKYLGHAGLEGAFTQHRQTPFVKRYAAVALYPREGVFLTYRNQHCVAIDLHVGLAGRDQAAPALVVIDRLDDLKHHAGELAVVVQIAFGHVVVEDRDAFVQRIFLLPGRGLHFLEAAAHDDLDLLAAQAPCRAAAVHRGIAATEHDHALANAGDVAERDRGQPVDTDMDIRCRLLPARALQVAPARGAAANEDRVIALVHQRAHRFDALAGFEGHAQVQHIAGFLVDHRFGQAKARNLRAYEAAGLGLAVEHGHVIAQRREIPRDGQRSRPGTDAGDALAVLGRYRGHACADVGLVVGGGALEPADRYRLRLLAIVFLDAPTPTGRLAGAVAGAAEHAGEDVGNPVDHVGVVVATLTNQAYVFGNRRMGRTRPLAIDDLVEIGRIGGVGDLQSCLLRAGARGRPRMPHSLVAVRRWFAQDDPAKLRFRDADQMRKPATHCPVCGRPLALA